VYELPTELSGEDVLPGFTLSLAVYWKYGTNAIAYKQPWLTTQINLVLTQSQSRQSGDEVLGWLGVSARQKSFS
jgi:hypothetical protein